MSLDTKFETRSGTMPSYPENRPPFFAQRYIRLMTKTCAAQEIGTSGFALCAAVACQEDAKRYSGPVTYFNGQLLPILGLSKWKSLNNARQAAIDAGWLFYSPSPLGQHKAGRYWVTIPSEAGELPDGNCDEEATELYAQKGVPKRDTAPHEIGPNGHIVGGIVGDIEGGNSPSCALSPNPNKSVRSSESKKKQAKDGSPGYSQAFVDWYSEYPRKIAKPKAAEAFTKAIGRLLADDERNLTTEVDAIEFLKRRAQAYASEVKDDEPKHICHPSTWLNGDRFDDEYAADKPQPNAVATKADLETEGIQTIGFDDDE